MPEPVRGEADRHNAHMLINSAAYEDGKRIAGPGIDELDACTSRSGGFVRVALREAARNGHQCPKLDEYGEALFVVRWRCRRSGWL